MIEYDESYYTTGNYEDYLDRRPEFDELAAELYSLLSSLDHMEGPILDLGCATGMLLDAFQDLGIEGEGVEISEWARQEAQEKGHTVHEELPDIHHYPVTFALDVLEHLEEEQLDEFLHNLNTEVLVFRVPTVLDGDDDYYIEQARLDPTHLIRWTEEEWKIEIEQHGYFVVPLMLPQIYCADGAYCGLAFKL